MQYEAAFRADSTGDFGTGTVGTTPFCKGQVILNIIIYAAMSGFEP